MKLLPKMPTEEMIEEGAQRLVRVETGNELWPDSWNPADVAAARNEAERCYLSMYAAAPEMKDEPVAFARTFDGEMITDSLTMFLDTAERELSRMNAEFPDVDRREIVPLYAHPSPRIAELEAEVARLKDEVEELVFKMAEE